MAQLTLVGRISEIIDEFFVRTKGAIDIGPSTPPENQRLISNGAERCVVLIQIDQSWGTGCLIKIDNDCKVVITCAHVVGDRRVSDV